MNNTNFIFFENYKKLEKICNEIYSANNGVTQYINEMENISYSKYRNIPNWISDLSTLKSLRHIRNQIAHNEGSFSENWCTLKDIEWLNAFYMRILKQTDPLALLHKQESPIKPKQPVHKNNSQTDFTENAPQKSTIKIIFIILSLIAITTTLCLIFGWLGTIWLFHL